MSENCDACGETAEYEASNPAETVHVCEKHADEAHHYGYTVRPL